MKKNVGFLVLFGAFLLPVCGDPALTSETYPGVRSSALTADNALSYNALQLNALSYNALSYNALSYNAFAPPALRALQEPGPSGDLARQFLKYAVSCALGSTQSFTFTWVDGEGTSHTETYPGLLGLVPSWTRGPLSLKDQGWLSACLISRVNWYEKPVVISMRGTIDKLKHPSSEEMQGFPYEEGAFFGNLFADPPVAYACHQTANMDLARSRSRDCAAGHVNPDGSISECGIIRILGACSESCAGQDSESGSRQGCHDGTGGMYEAAITIFLE